ncbi:hypothetical protein [Micromonospora sp. NPDC005172]|uniref:preATP grasp domain-containing protein n=1 Tax=Micromonospora sp. NPDC005172 TaxID=3156867 RepID=UPI0033AA4123
MARALWNLTENCIIVLPFRVGSEYVDHVTSTLKIDPELVKIVVADSLLWDEVLTSGAMWESIESARRELGGEIVNVEPCFHTAGVVQLRTKILGGMPGSSDAFLAEGGADFFNRKVLFRKLAASQGIPLPEGKIVPDADALYGAVHGLLPITGTVIIKRDNAGGGLGNFAITSDFERPIQGVSRGYLDKNPSREFLDSLHAEMCSLGSSELIVEAYHASSSAFFFEYFIDSTGAVLFVQSYEMKHRAPAGSADWWRTDWIGLEMPADLPPEKYAEARRYSERLFKLAADLGYRGYLHLDGIYLSDGRLMFNETNARWSGGTVLHKIGARVLGPEYRKSFLSSYRLLPAVPGSTLYPRIKDGPLAFSRTSADGNIAVVCDPEGVSETEILVVGQTRTSVVEGEASLIRYFSNFGGGPSGEKSSVDF